MQRLLSWYGPIKPSPTEFELTEPGRKPCIWTHQDLWVMACVLLMHVILSMVTQLSPDEAHYALYATHLDWSYYDHPPLVGWLQWP